MSLVLAHNLLICLVYYLPLLTCQLQEGRNVCLCCFTTVSQAFRAVPSTALCAQALGHVQLFAAPWTATCQAALSMDSSRQEYWSGLPFPPPGNLPHPGIKSTSLASPSLAGKFFNHCARIIMTLVLF